MRIACSILALTLLAAAPAVAAPEFFHADLTAVAGSGSPASGSASLILDAERGEVTYEISVQGLGSAEIGAHIHAAAVPAGEVRGDVVEGKVAVDETSLGLLKLRY